MHKHDTQGATEWYVCTFQIHLIFKTDTQYNMHQNLKFIEHWLNVKHENVLKIINTIIK